MNAQNIEDIYELSPLQQGMLFHTLYEPESKLYFEQVIIPLDGFVGVAAFEQAWNWVAEGSSILRTSFHWEGIEKPVQVVHRAARVPLEVRDVSGLTEERRNAELQTLLIADRERRFDMAKAPLLRLALLKASNTSYTLLFSFHHAILDGWSLQLVFRQFSEAYAAFCEGRTPSRARSRPYGDYIRWLQKRDTTAAAEYWRKTFAGFVGTCRLPIDPGANENGFSEHEIALSEDATARLRDFAARQKLTLNTLVQGAWAMLLRRMTSSDDVVFGVTASGRPPELADVENIIGLFINTVPLRTHVDPAAEVVAWLQALQQEQFTARQFDHTPLVQIREVSGFAGRGPLFETLLAFENYPVQAGNGSQTSAATFVERTNYPLAAAVVPGQKRLQIRLLYNTNALAPETVRRIGDRYALLFDEIPRSIGCRVGDVAAITAEDRALLQAVNDTRTDYPRDAAITDLVQEHVDSTPDAIAVEEGERRLTYAELDRLANAVASRLRGQGVGRGDRVGLMFQRSIEEVAAMLGVLKAGAAYVPIDPAYPAARINVILGDSGAKTMLTAADMTIDGPNEPVSSHVSALDAACVISTSGSTGTPKGVVLPHRGVVRLVRNTNYFEFTPADRVGHMANPAFDAATFEIWGALLNGGRLVIIDRETSLSPPALVKAIRDHGVTVLFMTTALFNAIAPEIQEAFSTLRALFFGGEAADARAVRTVLESRGAMELIHAYGPAESTTYATCHRLTALAAGAAAVPIGKPVANTTAYVLDAALQPVPPGATGELFVGGDGLALGYHDRRALTADRFLPDPFAGVVGARMYRTGDEVRWRSDGAMEFIGRFDHQIKLRGYRIELQEIESRIALDPNMRQSLVALRDDPAGGKQLVAYVLTNSGAPPDWKQTLRRELHKHLPDYMQPSVVMELEALPLTGNGKIDYNALPEPQKDRDDLDEAFVAPRTDIERKLAAIWQELLGLSRIGIHDVFLGVGGHSLRATQLVSRIRRDFGIEIPLRAVFEKPTIAELAQLLGDGTVEAPAATGEIKRVSRERHRVVS